MALPILILARLDTNGEDKQVEIRILVGNNSIVTSYVAKDMFYSCYILTYIIPTYVLHAYTY